MTAPDLPVSVQGMNGDLEQAPQQAIVLLHAYTHSPTGVSHILCKLHWPPCCWPLTPPLMLVHVEPMHAVCQLMFVHHDQHGAPSWHALMCRNEELVSHHSAVPALLQAQPPASCIPLCLPSGLLVISGTHLTCCQLACRADNGADDSDAAAAAAAAAGFLKEPR